MGVGFSSYDIARSGMIVNERSLHVTGHNIANVNTPGYVRQQAMIADSFYTGILGDRFRVGFGASIQEIRQIRYEFLDTLYRQENTTLGYLDAKAETFSNIEEILSEPMRDGLQSMMNGFWDSWQELAKEPNSLTARALVRQRADVLVNHINHIGEQLNKLQEDLDTEIRVRVNEVNNLLYDLAKLNADILRAETAGDTANDYRDRRNLLLDRLSELVDVDITEMLDGQVSVMSGGYFLLNKTDVSPLYVEVDSKKKSFYNPIIKELNVEVPLQNGILKGLIESRDEILPDIKNRLNTVVNAMISKVNEYHSSGQTLGGKDGADFFVAIDPTMPVGMCNIRLNSNLVDLNNIVSSSDGTSGNNVVAYQVANLRNQVLISAAEGELSIDDYYNAIILYVGHEGASLKSAAENQRTLVNAAESNRQSVMAVSLDEEMANMIKFKFAYNASSRTINVVDQMIDTIISKMGVIGR